MTKTRLISQCRGNLHTNALRFWERIIFTLLPYNKIFVLKKERNY